jgi:murein DD-endopeptidase MepM/ murein hydrolase activator NlpD
MRFALLTFAIASLSVGTLQAAKKPSPRHRSKHHQSSKAHPKNVAPDAGVFHSVQKGETAASIARANDLSLSALTDLNPDLNLNKLSIGAKLRLRDDRVEPALKIARVESPRSTPKSVTLRRSGGLPSTPEPHTSSVHYEHLLPYQPRAENPESVVLPSEASLPETSSALVERMEPVVVRAPEHLEVASEFVPANPANLDLLWPVETRTISSSWGPRTRVRTVRVRNHRKKRVRYRGRHKGVDLTAPIGTSVFAALDGRITYSGRMQGYGNVVMIDHGNGVMTVYGHHRANLVEVGDVVRRGQKIAEVGVTGNSTGPHLHFELRLNGVHQNPLAVLNDEEEIPAELQAFNATIGH